MRVVSVLALIAVAGCGSPTNDPPKGHNERLEKASGVAVFELVATPDLWDLTSPEHTGLHEVEGKNPGSDLADRGLQQFDLTGAQLAAYVDFVESCAYGGWFETSCAGSDTDRARAKRVYEEIAPVLDSIEGPRGADDPAPRVVIDDTSNE